MNNYIKRIAALVTAVSVMPVVAVTGLGAESGFVNSVEISYPVSGSNGFVLEVEEELPVLSGNGFIREAENDFSEFTGDGFLKEPENPLPVAGEDGFITEPERELPYAEEGFMKTPSKALPEITEGEFIAEIGEPDEKAKVINTAEELADITSGRYRLGKDIDLSSYNEGRWMPITPTGTVQLDGQGHIIRGLDIPASQKEEYAGLFGKSVYSIKIINTGLVAGEGDAINIETEYGLVFAGGFVACGNAIINNCFSNIPVRVSGGTSVAAYVGGLLGKSDGAITNCYYYGEIINEIKSYDTFSGGLLGSGRTAVTDCVNKGKVTGATTGGLVGAGGGSFVRCANEGSFNGKLCGGLIGKAGSFSLRLTDCYNLGNAVVSGYSSSFQGAGGLAGYCEGGVIDNCYNEGSINSESYGYAGGLVGEGDTLEITLSYNCGSINYNEENGGIEFNHPMGSTDFGTESGGLAGKVYELTATECINKGNVGGYSSGGFAGQGTLTAEYCVNEGNIAGIAYSGGFAGNSVVYVRNCRNDGNVFGGEVIEDGGEYYSRNYSKTGGIVGGDTASESRGYIENTLNNGNIKVINAEGYLTKQTYCGGIAGFSSAKVFECVNKGNIEVSVKEGTFTDFCAGGIQGSSSCGNNVERCINEGNITGDCRYASGIISTEYDSYEAERPGVIAACINNGNIDVSGYACGIGTAEEIYDCKSTGRLNGYTAEGVGTALRISNCFNSGDFGEKASVISGIAEAATVISFCYNTGSGTGTAEYAYGIAEEAEEVSCCFNEGSFEASDSLCGIAGEATEISGCVNRGNLGGAYTVGAGIGRAVRIVNCSNFGDIASGYAKTCGIGTAESILYCYNEGSLSSKATNLNDEEEDGNFGIGVAELSIRVCLNNGDISGAANGRMRGIGNAPLISECINNGDLSGDDLAGIGIADEIRNCKNTGSLTEVTERESYYVRYRGIGDGGLIYNCVNTGSLKGASCGGISNKADKIVACCNKGNIEGRSGEDVTGAGIFCGNTGTEISNSCNYGKISGVSEGFGIAGNSSWTSESADLINCVNYANVTATVTAAGLAELAGSITNCKNEGSTDAESAFGLAVNAYDIINSCNEGSVYAKLHGAGLVKEGMYRTANCYNSANVTVSGDYYSPMAAGLVLKVTRDCKITDSANRCSEVYARSTSSYNSSPRPYCGGIIAWMEHYSAYLNNVTNSAKISCHSPYHAVLGGICGYAAWDYRYEGDKRYDYPYLLVDKDTKSSGALNYTCEKRYNTDGSLYLERVNCGAVYGEGMVGYTSVELPSDISVSGGELLIKGKTVKLTATVLPESGVDKTVVWNTDNPAVATVSADGTVTGTGDGEAIISATTVNGLVANHKVKVLGNAIEVNVLGYRDGERFKAVKLPGAEVIIGGVTGYTDSEGKIVFDRKYLPEGAAADIKVSCGDDYKVIEEKILLLPNGLPKQTVSYFLEFIEEPIYFKKANARLSTSGETDLLTEKGITAVSLLDKKGELSKTSYAFDIEVDWRKCTENTGARSIFLRGKKSGKTITLGEGVHYAALAQSFEENEEIELVANTLDNEGGFVENSFKIPVRVRITNVKVEIPDTEAASLNEIEVMDDLNVRLSLGNITSGLMETNYKNGVLKIKIGGGDEDESKIPLGSFTGKKSISVSCSGEIGIPLNDIVNGEWSGSISAAVSQELDVRPSEKKKKKEKGEEEKKAKGNVKLFEHRRDMLISGVPCFVSFGLSAGAEATIGICGPFDKVTAGWGEIKVTGDASIKGGVGAKFSDNLQAEFGPKGTLEVELPAKISLDENFETKMDFDPQIKGILSAELIIRSKLIDIEGEIELGNFVWNKNGISWNHFLKPHNLGEYSVVSFGTGIAPVGREYRRNGGGFNAGFAPVDGMMLMGETEGSGRNEEILYSNIIRSADAGISSLDGIPVLIFTEDNLLRDEENGLTAAYSFYENGSWSEPRYIDDDGTEDTNVSADGKFAVWSDTSEKLEAGYTLSELLSKNEISAGVYNGSGYDSVRLTDNGIYDFGAKIKDCGDKGVVAWLSNTASDITCENGETSVHWSVYDNGWKATETISQIGTVTNLNIVSGEDKVYIVYKDSTNTLYKIETGSGIASEVARNVGRYTCDFVDGKFVVACFDEEGILHIKEDGAEVKAYETAYLASENPVMAVSADKANIFWIEGDGIYYVTNCGGEWSEQLCFINTDERIAKLGCTFKDQENYMLTFFSHGEEGTDLMSVHACLGKDIMLSAASCDEAFYGSDGKVKMTAHIFNNGEKKAENVNVTVSEYGKKVFESSYAVSLEPGKSRELEFSFAPENEEVKHSYEVSVSCEGDYHGENNSEEVSVGFCDLEISDSGFKEGGEEGEQIYARLRNAGNLPVEASVLRIYKGEEKEELICEASLGRLMPGEEAPVALDLIQEAGEVYHITVEAEDDSYSPNNSAMIYDDRIRERKSSLIYNKEEGTVTASVSRDELDILSGEFVWAIYSPAGHLLKVLTESFAAEENESAVEKKITAPAEGRVRLMIWKNISSMQPGFLPIDLLIAGTE